jgi:putative ABC transport system ATP-binding protein
MGDDELTRVRREQVGFVFQFFNLLPTLTVSDNIALPCLLAGVKAAEAESRAKTLAERVGIAHRLQHYPQQISGGEMQRAALARALIHQPSLIVADEPTGNLDSENGDNVLELLKRLNTEMGVTILLATHAADVAAAAHRVLKMRDGKFADRDRS